MPNPSLTFGFIVATLLGALFHLICGGDARRLAFFLLAGWLGFGLGQLIGLIFEIETFNFGPLHLLPAVVGAVVFLAFTRVVTMKRIRRRNTR